MNPDYSTRELDGLTVGMTLTLSVMSAIPIERHFTDPDNVPDVDGVVVNVATLWRNFYSSLVNPEPWEKVYPRFAEELVNIEAIVSQVKPIRFYITGGAFAVKKSFPKARVKIPETAKQVETSEVELLVLARVLKERPVNVEKVHLRLPAASLRVWLWTHHPVDLLNRYQFREVKLLESNTGNLTEPRQWSRKLTGDRTFNLASMPFNPITLAILGDGSVHFKSQSKFAKVLRTLAESKDWTPLTTVDKIKFDLNRHNPDIADDLLALTEHTLY